MHITQAAISARIRQLEELIGTPLFVRQRNNIALTPAGEWLLPQAELLMNTWNQLLLNSAEFKAGKSVLALGALPSVGEIFLEPWIVALNVNLPDAIFQIDLLNSAELLNRIRHRSLDVGLLYEPAGGANLVSTKLCDLALIPVTATNPLQGGIQNQHIQISWGASVDTLPADTWEPAELVKVRVDSPRMARQLLLHKGGVARMPKQLIEDDLRSGALKLIPGLEPILRELFLVHHASISQLGQTEQLVLQLQALAKT